MCNVATRSKPDGGALPSVVERFVSSARTRARDEGVTAEAIIRERLVSLTEMVGGYDFAEVVAAYWRGHETGDDSAQGERRPLVAWRVRDQDRRPQSPRCAHDRR